MHTTIAFPTLRGFSDLQTVRDLLARGDDGLIITNLPCEPVPESLLYSLSGTSYVLGDASTSVAGSTALNILARGLHAAAQQVLDHISHGLELPWERYLNEMHNLEDSGEHEILLTPHKGAKVPNKWSTLTVLVDPERPDVALISFGTALSVFSAGITPQPSGSYCDPEPLWALRGDQGASRGDSHVMAVYIRPSGDVLYTRTAGALMKPLSAEELSSVKRARDIDFGMLAHHL